MGAGHHPNALLLPVMAAIATGAPWICAVLMGWTAWRQPSSRGYLLAVVAACGIAALLAHMLAATLELPRPFMMGISPSYIPHGARGSLPSAHATALFTIAFACMLHAGLGRLGIALGLIALANGLARIYVGVHFPLDIAAGLLLALVISLVLRALHAVCLRFLMPSIARRGPAARDQMAPTAGRPAH